MPNKPTPNLHDHLRDAVEEFKRLLSKEKVCHGCGREDCDHSTTGCPMYRSTIVVEDTDKDGERTKELATLLHTTLLNTITLTLQAVEEAGPKDKEVSLSTLEINTALRAQGHNTANHRWRTALRKMKESLEGNK